MFLMAPTMQTFPRTPPRTCDEMWFAVVSAPAVLALQHGATPQCRAHEHSGQVWMHRSMAGCAEDPDICRVDASNWMTAVAVNVVAMEPVRRAAFGALPTLGYDASNHGANCISPLGPATFPPWMVGATHPAATCRGQAWDGAVLACPGGAESSTECASAFVAFILSHRGSALGPCPACALPRAEDAVGSDMGVWASELYATQRTDTEGAASLNYTSSQPHGAQLDRGRN